MSFPAAVPNTCQSGPCVTPVLVPSAFDELVIRKVLYIGTRARFVALSNGVALEVLDSGNIWQRQTAWTEN
jgi:hypothetical protein